MAAANEPIMFIDATNEPAVIEAVKGAAETTAADMATTKATDEAACAPEIAASDVAQAKATDEAEDARVASAVKMDTTKFGFLAHEFTLFDQFRTCRVKMDPAGDEESGATFKATDDVFAEKAIVEAAAANE